MPAYPPPPTNWFAQQLAGLRREISALRATRTQYIVDENNVCQAIIGNIRHDHLGNSTGLTTGSPWGIASYSTGTWRRI
jgi:hypothetical protein